MAFFKRVFSADFRRALAAEAAGDYGDAARAYALSGERHKVGEMHLLAAERAGGHEARLAELRAAVRWSDGGQDVDRDVRRRVARAMLLLVRASGVISESDRAVLREAAALFTAADDLAGAGECHELAGDEREAADSYQRAGEVDRLEAVLARDEKRRRKDTLLSEGFEDYQRWLAAGERDRALAALRGCMEVSPVGEYARLIESLEARRLTASRVTLRIGAERATYVGAFPLGLGREGSCEVALRDGGISRRHAEILEAGGRFRVRDCASKNGTFLAGCAVGGELPLDQEGELGLGELCGIRFRVESGVLTLTVARGLDRGLKVIAAATPFLLAGGAFELRFSDGRPCLSAIGGHPLQLNGARAGARIQLLRGDVVEVGEPKQAPARVEVEA
ncbi:MAG: FHA domain-containing protein [Myxococcales bacterium]|nr:FHA domain-containing protein [Myxococcales bacterium]